MARFKIDNHASYWRARLTAMNPNANFARRIGPDPHAGGVKTEALQNCPDLWELDDGNFAVIGIDITANTSGRLPPTAGCGPDERVIWIPRRLLVKAKSEIPTV